jgi:hypothetical protein
MPNDDKSDDKHTDDSMVFGCLEKKDVSGLHAFNSLRLTSSSNKNVTIYRSPQGMPKCVERGN